MKEFRTLRVEPSEEVEALSFMDKRNWHLDNRQEIYNATERVVGMTTESKTYGAFMQGFTGKDGKTETQVQTVEEVTHFISLTFSRETDTKKHGEIVRLEKQIDDFEFSKKRETEEVPSYIFGLIVGLIVAIAGCFIGIKVAVWGFLVAAVAAIYAVVMLVNVCTGKAAKIEEKNLEIKKENEEREQQEQAEYDKIAQALRLLLAEERTELMERGLWK